MILTWYKRTLKANIPIPTLTFQALDPTQGGTGVSTVSLLGTAQLLSSLSSQILSALRAAPDFPNFFSRASRGTTSLLGTEIFRPRFARHLLSSWYGAFLISVRAATDCDGNIEISC